MSFRSLKFLVVLSLLPASAHAANVVANSLASGPGGNPPARRVTTALGTHLPTGSLVRVGFFSNASANMAVLMGTDFNATNSLFLPLGEDAGSSADGTTGPIRANANGDFGGAIVNIDNAYMPAGSPLWLWVLNSPIANDSANEWVIFRDSSWIMPSGIGSINLATWQIDSEDEVVCGELLPNEIRMPNLLYLSCIPEPDSLALALLALVVMRRRRRR
jgi:hypothetical protein